MILSVAVSCGLSEVGEPVRNSSGGVWTGPGMNVGKEDPDRNVCHVVLLDYPDGYDWKADKEKGSVKCSLVVLADGIPMMKVPVGDEYETASDPDMHRLIGGHLYTDYSTDTETVIKKDGKELFRYPGRESICGMVLDSNDVYTLGHPREGKGFAYRKNGEVLLERRDGRSFGRLQRDAGAVCFAFAEPVLSATDTIERYYHVRDGAVTQAALREDVKKVWDIVSEDGDVMYVADVVGIRQPVLFGPDSMESLAMPEAAKMMTCRIFSAEGRTVVEGIYEVPGTQLTSAIWAAPDQIHAFPPGMTISSVCVSDGSICCMLNSSYAATPGAVYCNGDTYDMPLGYASMASETLAMVSGILQAGLSSKSCGAPVIWKDGALRELDYNGYISSVTVRQSSQETVLD